MVLFTPLVLRKILYFCVFCGQKLKITLYTDFGEVARGWGDISHILTFTQTLDRLISVVYNAKHFRIGAFESS